MKISKLNQLALVSVAAVISVAGQNAFAHTGIKDRLFVEGTGNTGSGAAAYNAFTITHGCLTNDVPEGGTGVRKDVIAMAAVFPNSTKSSDAIIYRFKTCSVATGVKGVDGTVLTG